MNTACDVIVVGSGAAGLAAACVVAAEGRSATLLEQSDRIGGTTAISGGMVWIPGNRKASEAGLADDLDAARRYIERTVAPRDPARLESFFAHGDEAVSYLERHTALRLRPVMRYPDYYPDLPGATLGGRVLEPEPYDAGLLQGDFVALRDPLPEFMLFGGMMISRQDIPHLRRVGRSLKSTLHVAGLLARHGVQRLRAHRGTTLYLGNALAGRLFQSARELGVRILTGATVEALRLNDGRVTGVDYVLGGQRLGMQARCGVVLATGGISHGRELRRRCVPAEAGALSATVDPGDAPRGAQLAADVGAGAPEATTQGAFWVPVSLFRRRDGSQGVFPHTVSDRAKPGLIAVGADGRRFVNEAVSYHEFVRAQLRSAGTAVPAWLLCDSDFLWKYGLGKVKPFSLSVTDELAQGYLHGADTLAVLATELGLPADALQETVETFNRGARHGDDPQFGRGGDAYQRHMGDADCRPNPCVAPLQRAPFYAVAVWPADLGMSAGLPTDGQARVLDAAGQPVPGLYACGNDMASVMEGAYPGPGITLGPALTFGYLAARHAIGRACGQDTTRHDKETP